MMFVPVSFLILLTFSVNSPFANIVLSDIDLSRVLVKTIFSVFTYLTPPLRYRLLGNCTV